MRRGPDDDRRSLESGYGINVIQQIMSHFIFKAKRPSGETYLSERDAASRFELYRLLRQEGDEVISVTEKSKKGRLNLEFSPLSIFRRVKTIEKINFARNLGSMLAAGLSLARTLEVLNRQSKNKTLRKVIGDLADEISQGKTLSDAMEKHPRVFSRLVISMVRAGEQSGTLAESLKVVSSQMESAYSLERRVRGALMYPTVIVFVMVVIGILMFIFVVPTLMQTFTDLNVTLPLTTRIILYASNTMQNYGLLILIAFLGVVGGFYWWRGQPSGKKIFHSLVLKMPIFGNLVREVNAVRTARTLASLLKGGVDVVESMVITGDVVQNIYFKAVLSKAGEAIKKGELMSEIFEQNENLYPPFMSEMMSVGEETGQIGEMLEGVARYYEDDVDQKTKDMSTVIEPVLMVIIASAVGFFAVSMISPMYSLVNAI